MGYGYGYGPGWGMMNGYGYGGGYGPVQMIVWVVIIVAVIALMMWLMRSFVGPGMHHHMAKRSSGLDVLEERYARGEVNRDEYLQKKKDIAG